MWARPPNNASDDGSRRSLLAEIALPRLQVTVLQRSVARPPVTRLDRIARVAFAVVTPTWRTVVRIVQALVV